MTHAVRAPAPSRAQEMLGGDDALQKLLQWRTPKDLERTTPDSDLEKDDD